MRKISASKHVVSMLTLMVILIPMLTLVVYASSPIFNFGHAFNGSSGYETFPGEKTDLGEATAGAAGVTVTTAELGAGRCMLSMENVRHITITSARTISSTGTYQLTYYMNMLPNSGSMDVYLACYAEPYVHAIAGRFQP